MRDFRKYEVWKEAIIIANNIYGVTEAFPKKEVYGLCNQMQRAAVSIPSNIAEGSSRTSSIEYAHFLEIAIGSAFEVETQLTIALQRNYVSQDIFNSLTQSLQKIERQLNSLIQKLRAADLADAKANANAKANSQSQRQ